MLLDVVEQQYPVTPRLALLKAKNAANQAGLERESYLRQSDENEVANYDVVNDLEDNQNADVDED